MSIPPFNLTRQFESIGDEINEAVQRVMASGIYILGPEVQSFEEQAAQYLGAKHAIGVANGTDAIWLALKALGVGPGDIVLTTPFTFFATAGAILNVGAEPYFVDIQEESFNIDPGKIRELLESNENVRSRAKVILPVHLYGLPADMEEIMQIAHEFELGVIEDNAQGIGAKYKSKMTGTIGDLGTISFFPTKNVGAFGDAGLVTTNSDELADRVRKLRVQGSSAKYYHELIGMNSRMDALQAAILGVKLKHLDDWISARQAHAHDYNALLGGSDHVRVPHELPERTHIYHQYTLRALNGTREALIEHLKDAGIGTSIHYPTPLHLQPALECLNFAPGEFPHSEKAANEVLSLPIFPELTGEERRVVANTINQFYSEDAVS